MNLLPWDYVLTKINVLTKISFSLHNQIYNDPRQKKLMPDMGSTANYEIIVNMIKAWTLKRKEEQHK